MKNFTLLCLMFCISLGTFAQATSLTIDNQTPGWLSSKINYSDQQTIENIKVTGYINSSDLSFIGSLILNHSLHGKIDLSDAEITSKLTQRMFGIDIFNNTSQIEVKYLSLPNSMPSPEGCGMLNGLRIDTLEVGGYNYKTIMKNDFYYPNGSYPSNANAKNVKIREGVEVIGKNAFAGERTSLNYDNTYLEAITLPNSMKRIENGAFSNCTSLNYFELPDSIEYLGSASFVSSLIPDTFHLPKMLKTFNASNFASCYKYGLFLHIPENVDTIIGADCETYCNYEYTQKGRTPSYLKIDCKTPPRALTSSFSGYHLFFSRFSWECVYVPKGTLEAYQSAYYVPNNNITNFVEYIEVEKIEIPSMMKLYVGDMAQMDVKILPEDATNKRINIENSNESVITILEDMTLYPLKYGEANIKVLVEDNKVSSNCVVKVFEHTTGINFQEKMVIPINKKRKLSFETLPLNTSDGEILFSTSDDYIAQIDESGNVRAINQGRCIITATTVDGGFTATCEVMVTQPVEALTMEKHSIGLKVGETEKIYVQIYPATADNKDITCSTSDEQVVAVDAFGNVTAIKAGEAWIKAVSQDNPEAKDSCKVTVVQPVTGITLSQTNCKMTGIGESLQLEAYVQPTDATNKEVKWTSTNEAVCVVGSGLVISTGYGMSVVLASTIDGGFIASCVVTVEDMTAIRDVEDDNQEDSHIYDLTGRKVIKPEKGKLYIRNKKVFMVK